MNALRGWWRGWGRREPKPDDGVLQLIQLMRDDDLGFARALLEDGVDVNGVDESGYTPIISAAIGASLEFTRLLIEYGANLEVMNGYGWRPIHIAARNGRIDTVRLLIDKGAWVDAS